jgi:hypothetical protein
MTEQASAYTTLLYHNGIMSLAILPYHLFIFRKIQEQRVAYQRLILEISSQENPTFLSAYFLPIEKWPSEHPEEYR